MRSHGALVGFLTALPLIAMFYLGAQLAQLPFLPLILADFAARLIPGPAGQAAGDIAPLLGIVVSLAVAALLGARIAQLVAGTPRPAWQVGARVGSFAAAVAILLFLAADPSTEAGPAALWIAILIGGWGALTGRLLQRPRSQPPSPVES